MVRFTGVFEPLRDAAFFAKATVHPELRTVYWPNAADLDSEVLYARVTGKKIYRLHPCAPLANPAVPRPRFQGRGREP